MQSNVIFIGWSRSVPGREQASVVHFNEFIQYLGEQQAAGTIDSFIPVFLEPHGGDMNDFIVLVGAPEKLAALRASEAWTMHMMRAAQHLANFGYVGGVTGEALQERLRMWQSMVS